MTKIIDLGINVVEGREFRLCETCPDESVGSCEEPSKDDGGRDKDKKQRPKYINDVAIAQLKQQLRNQLDHRI
jgi:hypothetical protein